MNIENTDEPKIGDLRVWWIPQIPMSPFFVPVRNLREAELILVTLADYDQFQLDNNVKPDYSNAGGLMIFEAEAHEDGKSGDWTDWEDPETGVDFDEYREENTL